MKKKPGRPKSKDPKKYVCSVRLTKEEMKKVRAKYKTFANMIKQILSALSVAILITSCGGSGGGAGVAENGSPASLTTTGNLYAISVNIQKPYSLGYELSYSCSGDNCSFTGELHHWNTAGTFVTKAQVNTGSLAKSGDNYVGIFYLVGGQQFNVSVNIGQNFVKMDNGVNCTRRQATSTLGGYDAYLGSVANVDGVLSFNALTIGQCEL